METMISQFTVIALVLVIVIAIVKVFSSGDKEEVNERQNGELNQEKQYDHKSKILEDVYSSKNSATAFKRTRKEKYNLKTLEPVLVIEQFDFQTKELIKSDVILDITRDYFVTAMQEEKDIIDIGRNKDADIVVEDESGYIGNFHASLEIEKDTKKVYIIDRKSKNGTFNNEGNKIEKEYITHGSRISLANEVILKFTFPQAIEIKKSNLNCARGATMIRYK